MRLRWSPRALGDLDAIRRYIAGDNPAAARRWIDRLYARVLAMTATPLMGRNIPELDRKDVREVLVGSYRIVYRVGDDERLVLTVFEGHRLFPGAVLADLEDPA